MHNKHSSKLAAFLTAVVMTSTGMSNYDWDAAQQCMQNKVTTQKAQTSVLEFSKNLDAMEIPESVATGGSMAELKYEPKKGFVSENGPYRKQCGEFFVENDQVRVKNSDGTSMSLQEAERRIGCEVQTKEDGSITISSPFRNARLIVSADNEIDTKGANSTVDGFRNLHVLQYDTAEEAYKAYCEFKKEQGIDFVSPDRVYHICEAEEDMDIVAAPVEAKPSFGVPVPSWGVDYIGANDFYADYLQEIEEKDALPELKVAIIDTGIYSEHSWFEGRIAEGGVSFCEPYESNNDGHGHGSHCAGIVCSVTDDNVKILSVKALSDDGYGSSISIYCAMLYAVEQGADVISMSLGGEGEDPLFDEAIKEIEAAGIPLCVAAGNEANDAKYSSPARNPYCFTIAAMEESGEAAYFSNYGEGIDFAAPGVSIESAGLASEDATAWMDGTSMATPFVAGCCAAILSVDPDLSVDTLEEYFKANVTDLGDPGFDSVYGWGAVNLKDFRMSDVYCARPVFSRCSSNLNEPFVLEMSCETEGATIMYTLDNSIPTPTHGTVYTEPIAVWRSERVRAIAYLDDLCSHETSEAYCIRGDEVINPLRIEGNKLVAYDGFLKELDLSDNEMMEGVTEIADGAFANDSNLESVIFPDTVTKFGKEVFKNDLNLKTVVAKGVTEIGESCFSFCKSLSVFEGISNLTVYSDFAFYDASCLEIPLKGVTEIGEFSLVASNLYWEDASDFAALRTIGASAFDSARILKCTAADFSQVTSFADSALSYSNFEEVILPADMTTIPSNLLLGAVHLRKLSAPSVTKVCMGGLALTKYGLYDGAPGYYPCQTDIDFENKLTETESGAFGGFYFDKDIRFSALKDTTLAGFSGVIGSRLSFPSVTSVDTVEVEIWGMIFYSAITVDVDVLELENVERIAAAGLSDVGCLVVGNALKECGPSIIISGGNIVAGPEGGYMQQYADACGYTFKPLPCVIPCAENVTVKQNSISHISCAMLEWDMTGKWTELDENGERTENVIEGGVLELNYSETGTYSYIFEAFRSDGVLYGTYPLTVEVLPCVYKDIALDENIILERDVLWDEDNSVIYRFTPEEDMTVNCLYGCSILKIDGFNNSKVYSKDFEDPYGMCSLELNAGQSYFFYPQLDESFAVMKLTLDDAQPEGINWSNLSVNYFTDTGEDYDPDDLEQIERIIETEVSIIYEDEDTYTNEYKMLERGKDYELYISKIAANVYVTVYGINDYFGAYSLHLYTVSKLQEDVPKQCGKNEWAYFSFTPETDGYYHFFTMFDDDVFKNTNKENHWAHVRSMISIWDNYNMTYVNSFDDTDMYAQAKTYSYIGMWMIAGESYDIQVMCEGDSSAMDILNLVVSREDNILADAFIDCDDMFEKANESERAEHVFVVKHTENGEKTLEYGKDYELYFEDDASDGITVVANGIGDYYGQVSIMPNTGTEDTYDLLVFDEKESFRWSSDQKMLVLEEPTVLKFETMFPFKTLPLAVYEYVDGDVVPNSYRSYDIMKEQLALDAGTYLITSVYDGKLDVIARNLGRAKSFGDVELNYESIMYGDETHEITYDMISVSYDGEALVPEQDFVFAAEESELCGYGSFEVKLLGTDEFFGERMIEILVLPKKNGSILTAKEGINTVEIAEKRDSAVFRWVPCAEHAVIKNNDPRDITFTFWDSEGTLLSKGSGLSVTEIEPDVQIGKTYYIVANYTGHTMTGKFDFAIEYHQFDLNKCEVIQLSNYAYSGEDVTPFVHFVDGNGKVLRLGVDYELQTDANVDGIGYSEFVYHGIGNYFGTKKVTLTIYDDFVTEYDATYELLPWEENMAWVQNPGEAIQYFCTNNSSVEQRYSFKYMPSEYAESVLMENQEIGECLDYDLEHDAYCILVYDNNKDIVLDEENPLEFTLQPGESRFFRLVARSFNSAVAFCEGSVVIEQIYKDPEFVKDGVHYTNIMGEMQADALLVDAKAYVIPPSIVTEDGSEYPVGISYDVAEQLVYNGAVVFSTMESGAASICYEYGILFVPLIAMVWEAGDINMDYCFDYSDLMILSVLLNESGVLNADVMQRADVNGDGNLDMADMVELKTKIFLQESEHYEDIPTDIDYEYTW